jgi:hypothetical protein
VLRATDASERMTELEELQRLAPSSCGEEADVAGGDGAVSIDTCLDAIGVGPLQWSAQGCPARRMFI